MNCQKCKKSFSARVFDLEIQLMAAGWAKAGDSWLCADCRKRSVRNRCIECEVTFPVPLPTQSVMQALKWAPVGDRWMCPRCGRAARASA
jgi:hypothetical protein